MLCRILANGIELVNKPHLEVNSSVFCDNKSSEAFNKIFSGVDTLSSFQSGRIAHLLEQELRAFYPSVRVSFKYKNDKVIFSIFSSSQSIKLFPESVSRLTDRISKASKLELHDAIAEKPLIGETNFSVIDKPEPPDASVKIIEHNSPSQTHSVLPNDMKQTHLDDVFFRQEVLNSLSQETSITFSDQEFNKIAKQAKTDFQSAFTDGDLSDTDDLKQTKEEVDAAVMSGVVRNFSSESLKRLNLKDPHSNKEWIIHEATSANSLKEDN